MKIAKSKKNKAMEIFSNVVQITRRCLEDGFNPVEIKITDDFDKSALYRRWLNNPYSTFEDNGDKTFTLTISEHLWYELVIA